MQQSLIERAQRGDKEAFRQLYQETVGRIFGLCLRLVNDVQVAEDVTQEVYVKAWRALDEFRGDADFSTWLHRIASTTAIDHWRRNRKLVAMVDESMDELSPLEALAHRDSSAEKVRDLQQAIQRLPDQARAVFVLFAIEGYGHAEIATLLNIAQGSSKAQYHRARQLLQDWLDDE